MSVKWYASLIEVVVSWFRPREHIPIPDIRDIREADATREVRILRLQEEQDRLADEKRKRQEAAQTIK